MLYQRYVARKLLCLIHILTRVSLASAWGTS